MEFISMFAAAVMALTGATSTSANVPQCVTIERVLETESTGVDVKGLQGFLGVRSTGYFGPITKAALIKWQIEKNIVASAKSFGAGTVGPRTRLAMRCKQINPSTQSTSAGQYVPSFPNQSVQSVSSAPIPATPPPVATPPPMYGGGGYSTQQCPAFTTPKPAAAECTVGTWTLIANEAGCPAEWYCDNPNEAQ